MRQILLFSLALLQMAEIAISQVPTPVPGWPYRSGSNYIFSRSAVGRFADEGFQKHLYFNIFNGEMQKFNMDGSFASGWPFYCDTLLFGSDPVILDIDHDGRFEMLNYGTRRALPEIYSLLFLIDDDGTIMPGFPIRLQSPYRLAAGDMDNDNEYEILYFSSDEGIINCLDRYGNPKPGWPIPLPFDNLGVGGSIGDLDLDGANELVMPGYRNIYAYRFDGAIMDGFPVALEDTNFVFLNASWPTVLVDFDRDGYLEIIMGGTNGVYQPEDPTSFIAIYDHNGILMDGWPRYYQESYFSSITPSDIDNNGTIDLGFQGHYLHFVDLDGGELPGWPVALTLPDGSNRTAYSDLSIADVDGDGPCEIFTDFNVLYPDSLGQDSLWYYGYSYLFALDHTGQPLPGYPIEVEGSYLNKPPAFSLDRLSNRLYISVATDIIAPWVPIDTAYLELYQFPDSTGPPSQWPMLSHDNLHTRNYNFVDRVTSVDDDDSEVLPQSPLLRQNYPNPFNLSTTLEFILPKEEHVALSIFDLLGKKVVDIYDEVMTTGVHRYRFNMDMPSGVYLYRLKTGSAIITRKMTLVK